MSEMVERVARALAEKRYVASGGASGRSIVPPKQNWEFCVTDARIAIEAMRVPLLALFEEHYRWDSFGPMSAGCWAQILDEALQLELREAAE